MDGTLFLDKGRHITLNGYDSDMMGSKIELCLLDGEGVHV